MSTKYDSVLKEKKKYVEVVDDRHFLRKHILLIDFLVVMFVLIISFVIYMFNILSPARMVFEDVGEFLSSIEVIYKKVFLDYDFAGNYNFSGEVEVSLDSNYGDSYVLEFMDGLNFEYSILDNGFSRSLNIDSADYSLNYYEDKEKGYLNYGENFIECSKLKSVYYMSDYENIMSKISELFYQELKKLDWKKSVFVDDGAIVVSVDLSLDGSYINEVYTRVLAELGDGYKSFFDVGKIVDDGAKYQLTIKNDLFNNDLVNLKMVINDGDYRGVFNYQNGVFIYNDGDRDYKGILKIDESDFSFRFYQKDVMKYIIFGKDSGSGYVYTYQVINEINNMSFKISKDKNVNNYILNIKKEGDEYLDLLISASMKYSNDVIINNNIGDKDYLIYSDLSDGEKDKIDSYVNKIYNSLSNLFNFVK